MVGNYVDSIGCQVGYIPFDYKRQTWSRPSDWKWQAVPCDPAIFPDLVPVSSRLGEVTQEASESTGIPVGTPVIAAAADKACEVIGAGCLNPEIACLSYGTTATINTTQKRYIEVIPLIPPYPAAVPNAYSLEVQIYRGYWMVSWFKKEFGYLEEYRAAEMGMQAEVLFDELVQKVPPGSDGLVLQPYWSPGLKIPGPEARGSIIGFSDEHTRAHLYRAILEGLGFALREGAERTEKATGTKIKEIRVAGGGSQSKAAMQLTADIFNLPTTRAHIYEASRLGAAIDASVGVGLYPDFESAVSSMTHHGEVFVPDKTRHELYDQLFEKIYKKMYARLKPLFDNLHKLDV